MDQVLISLQIPLADPDFLQTRTHGLVPSQMGVLESSALSGLGTLATAEVSYAAVFPELGFTCTLSDLGGSGDVESSSHAASLINKALASGSLATASPSLMVRAPFSSGSRARES